MTTPSFQDFMLPTLRLLADGQTRPWREVAAQVADALGLTDDDRAEALPNGKLVFENRQAWALTHLGQAGLISRPVRGSAAITAAGQAALGERPDRVDMSYLQRYPAYQEFRARRGTRSSDGDGDASTDTITPPPDDHEATPEDLMSAAERENRAGVESELLDRLRALDPTAFERLVLNVLTGMGYGGKSGAVEHTGKIGDGGIDGLIRQDPLGLDRIYMQAKRYSAENSVGRPAIQAFVGALHGQQADRGVFITTSTYSREAVEYTRFLRERIVLIDGRELARLMVLNNVGVQDQSTFVLKRMDEDYFESL
ncbi:MAG TPA: restriction endonuclease [Cellulomonas sp.]